jgi:hypothetical protein
MEGSHLFRISIPHQEQDLAANQSAKEEKCRHLQMGIQGQKDMNGNIDRFKARLVARGFTQVYGVDYLDTFALVAKLDSLRILLAITAIEDLEAHQMDVVTAFLAGDIDKTIYMEQPEGFEAEGDKVCLLLKSLYGLKQAARVWNQKIRNYLLSLGFTQLHSDHCVYINKDTGLIIALWVDDLLIFGKNVSNIGGIKQQLRDKFEMKDLGELQYFLGMKVQRDRTQKLLHIDQAGYTNSVVERFNMQNSSPADTPLAAGTKLVKPTVDDILVEPVE